MIVSVTERGTYKRCHKKWDIESRNRKNLGPIVPPTALSLGSLIHKALQIWTETPEIEPQDAFGKAAMFEITAMKLRYRAAVGAEMSDYEFEQFKEMFALGHEMMVNYKNRWGSPLPEGFSLVQAEQTIIIPIPNTSHTCACLGIDKDCPHCQGSGRASHYLEGTLDAVIQEEKSGLLFVLERKTYGSRPRIDVLEANDQFTAYCWILKQMGIGDVAGVAYDGMWKRPIEGARTTRNLEDLFLRTLLTRSPQEIDNFEVELSKEVNEMAHPQIYRNFRSEGCWDCSVKSLCLSEFRGEDWQYVLETEYMTRDRLIPWDEEEIRTT